jgi:hypothetical protein
MHLYNKKEDSDNWEARAGPELEEAMAKNECKSRRMDAQLRENIYC